MAELYPIEISSCIEKGSYKNAQVDSVLSSSVDGNINLRNRHTIEMYNTSWTIKMNEWELNVLTYWYYTVLLKVKSFYFDEPITGQTREYFFITAPTHAHIGGNQFIVTFNLETA